MYVINSTFTELNSLIDLQQLLDNRVLAVEVAEKHDQILRLKSEVNQLEDNLRQANMQTHFKDDVIKELRRDCRNLMVINQLQ